jgi:hypothetical protein
MVNPVGLVKWVTFNSYAALIHTFLTLTLKTNVEGKSECLA